MGIVVSGGVKMPQNGGLKMQAITGVIIRPSAAGPGRIIAVNLPLFPSCGNFFPQEPWSRRDAGVGQVKYLVKIFRDVVSYLENKLAAVKDFDRIIPCHSKHD